MVREVMNGHSDSFGEEGGQAKEEKCLRASCAAEAFIEAAIDHVSFSGNSLRQAML